MLPCGCGYAEQARISRIPDRDCPNSAHQSPSNDFSCTYYYSVAIGIPNQISLLRTRYLEFLCEFQLGYQLRLTTRIRPLSFVSPAPVIPSRVSTLEFYGDARMVNCIKVYKQSQPWMLALPLLPNFWGYKTILSSSFSIISSATHPTFTYLSQLNSSPTSYFYSNLI